MLHLFRKSFFTDAEKQRISKAVKTAEAMTSGEIKVYVESNCKKAVMGRAIEVFQSLELEKTRDRNAVLFYIAHRSRKFGILGDEGIHRNVQEAFWHQLKEEMETYFKNGQYTEGLEYGILRAGEKLKHHFPHQGDDVNEISDDIAEGR